MIFTPPTMFLCLDASPGTGGVYYRLRTEVENALDPRVESGHVHTWPIREGLEYEIYSTLLEVGREHREHIVAGYSTQWKGGLQELLDAAKEHRKHVVAGYATRWNGSAMVAEYTEDAIEHLRQIQEEVDTINAA